jgi:hypothetical protein
MAHVVALTGWTSRGFNIFFNTLEVVDFLVTLLLGTAAE